jgi:hypothetical protein
MNSIRKKLVVDVEPKRLGGGIKVRSIDEQRKPFVLVKHLSFPSNQCAPIGLP